MPVDYNRQYRANNGTVWDLQTSLKFWLRASGDVFIDKSSANVNISKNKTITRPNCVEEAGYSCYDIPGGKYKNC